MQMKHLARRILVGCCIVLFASGVFGQNAQAPTPFDQYGRINWYEELKHLDNFAKQLKDQPEMIGYVCIQEAQISGAGYAVGHAIDIKHHIAWNRVAWRDLGFGDSFQTTLWLYPAGAPPVYLPKYQPETSNTFIEGYIESGPRFRRHRKKRRMRPKAPNSPLE
jgi:hypothetical protein